MSREGSENESIKEVLLFLLCTFKDVSNKYIHQYIVDEYIIKSQRRITRWRSSVSFYKEVALLKGLNHPNIVKMKGVCAGVVQSRHPYKTFPQLPLCFNRCKIS